MYTYTDIVYPAMQYSTVVFKNWLMIDVAEFL